MGITPLSQFMSIFIRKEPGPASLIGFANHAGNIVRVNAFFFQGPFEQGEGLIFKPKITGEGHLMDVRVRIYNPVL